MTPLVATAETLASSGGGSRRMELGAYLDSKDDDLYCFDRDLRWRGVDPAKGRTPTRKRRAPRFKLWLRGGKKAAEEAPKYTKTLEA